MSIAFRNPSTKSLTFYTNMKPTAMMTAHEMPECNCKAFNHSFDFQHDDRRIVPFRDKGHSTEYRYVNHSSDHLAKYRVDGGLIADEGAKCDYLLLNCEKKQSYFIELKGCDLIHAVDQIDRSIEELKNNLPGFAFFARIVLTRVNTTDLHHLKFLRLEKKVKSMKGNLKKQTRLLEETV